MKDDNAKNGKNRLLAHLRKTQTALSNSQKKIAELEEEIAKLNEQNEVLLSASDWSKRMADEQFVEEFILGNEKIKAQIIGEYLRKLTSAKEVAVLRGNTGSTPLTPPKKPKSLAEAKKLAEILIKG